MKNVFKSIYDYMISQRRSGTTTLIKEVSKTNDVNVLVRTMQFGAEFGKSAVSIHEIANGHTQDGTTPKPVLIDNSTMIALMRVAAAQELKLNAMKELIAKFQADMDAIARIPDESIY